jgi:precorrin-3B C17-methyltransferase
MVTPRGYANKYDMQDGGATREGERAGRSLSTGLLGWLDTLRAEHEGGASIEALAAQYRLPADYIRSTLDEPWEAEAADATEESEA